MPAGAAPHLLVAAPQLVRATAAALRSDGWTVLEGFSLPDEPWDVSAGRVVCCGPVSSPADAGAALLCAARGARLVVAVTEALLPSVYDDLRRSGGVEYAAAASAGTGAAGTRAAGTPTAGLLTDDQVVLLTLLAAGHSLTESAQQLFLSQRTAERRLAAARDALGAASTAEALVRFSAGPGA